VDVDEKGIQVTAKGRLLIRNICMCFDAYLRQKARMQQFSRDLKSRQEGDIIS
jgi:oxygen-independent coproporphyrinogen-3 oxidase